MLPFQNPGLAAKERAEDLLARLTLDEKLGMLNMNNEAVPRLGIPEYHWWNEALHGVARNGKAAMFPQAIALAATFTPEYAEKMGKVIREEAWIKYQHYSRHGQRGIYCGLNMYSPNINIFRDPRWGRGHETYGECPVLTALMGSAYVRGVQGDDPEHLHCSTTLKHFAAHSGPERFRSHFDSEVSARDLAQTYLFAFRFCLKHHPAKSIMTAYNALNGTPMSVNRTILGETVREQWGFSGVTVTDVGTAANLVNRFKICRDYPEALALEISSGVDVCCEMFEEVKQHFREAFRRGLLKTEDIDRAVRNQLTLKFQLGLFDPQELPDYARLECREHRELSRSIAERGMVLLKNDGLLPLRPGSFRKIAVIGPTADDREVLRGNYAGTATRYITILDGLLDAFGEDNVIYARGCEIQDTKTEICARDGDRMTEALVAAEQADLVVMCLGLTPIFEGEIGGAGTAGSAGDKLQLEYSSPQKQLLGLIRSAGKPIVLLNCSGSAVVIPETEVNAVLQIFYPGPDGGRVAADILTGKVNPSGRLPVTFYRSTELLPPFENYSMQGRTYRYCRDNILYPFGYGLSYTDFEYSGLEAEPHHPAGEGIPCRIRVRNAGRLAGETAVLFFFRHENGPEWEPLKQFAGAVRVKLEPGETAKVEFTYPEEFLQFADEHGDFYPVTGKVTLMAENCRLTVTRE